MTDYNQDIKPGNIQSGAVNVVIEIPLGSTEKIEWNRGNGQMEVNRVEPSIFPEPVNYGFVPQTTGGDGDNLDAIVISNNPIPTSSVLETKIIGIMKFIDEGEVDDKIVVTLPDSTINEIADLPKETIEIIVQYFNHYKDYIKPGITSIVGWGSVNDAKVVIEQSINRLLAEK